MAFLDTFNRANSSTVGNGWAQSGSAWSIQNNKLHATSATLANDCLYRPEAEALLEQEIDIDFVVAAGQGHWCLLRSRLGEDSSDKAGYIIGVNDGTFAAYRFASDGNFSQIGGTGAPSIAVVPGHTYRFSATATGANPTTISLNIADLTVDPTGATSSGTFTRQDSTASLQTAGVVGVTGFSLTTDVSRIATNYQEAPATTILEANSVYVTRSPYNWREMPDGALQAWNSGAYLVFHWTGSSTAKFLFDQSGVIETVVGKYRLDGGDWSFNLNISPSVSELDISGISGTGNHTLEIMLSATPQSSNRWEGVENVLRVVGLDVGTGMGVTATVGDKSALLYGDSIWEGIGTTGQMYTYAGLLAQHLRDDGYEVGIVASGYGGWLSDVPMGVPHGFDPSEPQDWWDMVDADTARVTGMTWPDGTPDLILTAWGTNDQITGISDADVLASVSGFIVATRGAAPTAKIGISVPVGGQKRSVLLQAVEAASSPLVRLLDMGELDYQLHPNNAEHAEIAALFTPLVDDFLASNSGTGELSDESIARIIAAMEAAGFVKVGDIPTPTAISNRLERANSPLQNAALLATLSTTLYQSQTEDYIEWRDDDDELKYRQPYTVTNGLLSLGAVEVVS